MIRRLNYLMILLSLVFVNFLLYADFKEGRVLKKLLGKQDGLSFEDALEIDAAPEPYLSLLIFGIGVLGLNSILQLRKSVKLTIAMVLGYAAIFFGILVYYFQLNWSCNAVLWY